MGWKGFCLFCERPPAGFYQCFALSGSPFGYRCFVLSGSPFGEGSPRVQGINILKESNSSISNQPSPIRNLEHPFAIKTRIDQCKRMLQIGDRVLIAD
jgi:hypothetical protein